MDKVQMEILREEDNQNLLLGAVYACIQYKVHFRNIIKKRG
jgi:hypothetical protein